MKEPVTSSVERGTLFSRDAEFQECAAENERTLQMVECKRCRRILKRAPHATSRRAVEHEVERYLCIAGLP